MVFVLFVVMRFCSVCGHEGRKMMKILELEMVGTGEGGREIEN